EWLVNQDLSNITLSSKWRLFPHCIERSSAQQSNEQWKQIFASIGSELEIISTSCCGMGGLFGHQKEHKQVSLDIWDIHWGQHNPQSGNALTTGYSCYSQAKRIENISLLHPLEVIATTSPTTR
ncbi:MAG TPA: (Fe-S)-binding protein, partial [Phycisphaerales bacterium]|nr:(Fe-S)-binding protein [Phycisphaerales bacterium]